MKGLKTLIRVHKNALDEQRKQLGIYQDKRDRLIARYHALHEELLAEIEASKKLTDVSWFFGDFSEAIKKKQMQVREDIKEVETFIQRLTIDIQRKFSEMKKYEIAKEKFDEEELAALNLANQKAMDEIGLQGYMRQSQEEAQ